MSEQPVELDLDPIELRGGLLRVGLVELGDVEAEPFRDLLEVA